jgi:hypothetical protein
LRWRDHGKFVTEIAIQNNDTAARGGWRGHLEFDHAARLYSLNT